MAMNQNSQNNISAFFNEYPNADSVLKVGDELFLVHYLASVIEYARRKGLEVETIKNPNHGIK